MTDWNEAAEPRCGQNTTLNTALPQLHTLQTPKTPSPFTFPQQIRCSTRPGTLPPLEFSGRRGSGEVCTPEADFHPSGPLPSSLATRSSRLTAGARCSCTMHSSGEGGDLILENSVIVFLPSHWHLESIFHFVFRGYTSFLSLWCLRGITQASL